MVMLKSVEKYKIRKVFFSIKDDKSSGSDGFGSGFFKVFWDIIGDEICVAVLEFFVTGKFFKQVNFIFIFLIEKFDESETVGD